MTTAKNRLGLARVTPYSFNSLVTAFENVGEGV